MTIDPLEHIVGVQEAAEKWGMSAVHVKRLCRDGDIDAKKIGKTWIIRKSENNPRKRNNR